PATAMASNGSNVSMGIVVWTQSNSNGDTDIMARTGSPPSTLGSTFTVANTSANEDNADVAMDQNGDFVVVWVSTQNNNSDILYAFYRSGQTTPFQSGAVAATSLQEVDPQVAMNKQGAFVVTYTVTNEPSFNNNNQTVTSQVVRAQLFDNLGNQNQTIRVATSNTVDQFDPRISMSPNGRFAISYMQSSPGQPSTNQKLFVSIYTINSSFTSVNKNGNFKILAPSSSQPIIDQDVAVDTKGNTLVVFNQQTQSSPQTQVIKARRVNSSNSEGSTFTVQSSSFDLGSAVRVVMNATDKDFAVTFQ